MNDVVLHVQYIHRGFDIPLHALGVTPTADEQSIKQALASYLVVPLAWLNSFIFQRRADGDLALRLDE